MSAGASGENSREFVSEFQEFDLILCKAPVSNFFVSLLSYPGESAFLDLGNSRLSAHTPCLR